MRRQLGRALGLLLLACTLTGCVEAVSWAAFGLLMAQDLVPTPTYTKDWPGYCALPGSQTVRLCSGSLQRQGWVRVEIGPDSQWRPVSPRNVEPEKEN